MSRVAPLFLMAVNTPLMMITKGRGLIDKIKEDDDVTFELTEGRKGLNAVNVKLI